MVLSSQANVTGEPQAEDPRPDPLQRGGRSVGEVLLVPGPHQGDTAQATPQTQLQGIFLFSMPV